MSEFQTSAIRERSRRYSAAEALSDSTAQLIVLGRSFVIRDLSLSGVAVEPRNESFDDMRGLVDVSLKFGRAAIIDRKAKFVRRGVGAGGAMVAAFSFAGGLGVEPPSLAEADLAAQKLLTAPAAAGATADLSEYIAFVKETAAWIDANRARLPREAALGWQEAADALFDETVDEWRAIMARGNEFVLRHYENSAALAEIRRIAEAQLTSRFVEAANWRRCFIKPLGYPGDFLMMNLCYDVALHGPMGETARERYLFLIGLEAGALIPSRNRRLAALIEEKIEAKSSACLVSIGSGPARELDILAANRPVRQLTATLIDIEQRAHDYVRRRLRVAGLDGQVSIDTQTLNFLDLARQRDLLPACADADVIYSSGLSDYFKQPLAQRFVANLFKSARSGARIIICNVNRERDGAIWVMSCLLDWDLYFRNREDMISLAVDCAGAHSQIVLDESGAVYCLVIDKP